MALKAGCLVTTAPEGSATLKGGSLFFMTSFWDNVSVF